MCSPRLAILTGFLLAPLSLLADPPDASAPDKSERAVSEHTVMIGKEHVDYTATADFVTLWKDPDASPRVAKGKVFYVAYTRKGVAPGTRPIAFCFNGGPGSASMWLHLGIGPRRVDLPEKGEDIAPPFHLVDNAETWLDRTDLVFVDPVPTGFSRVAPGVDVSQFEGNQNDLETLSEFIQGYIAANGRWLSPKILVGESYGTTRVAGLAAMLPQKDQIGLNGIVLISQDINYDAPYAQLMRLPSYAATAWYHGKIGAQYRAMTLEQVCDAAEVFLRDEYVPAFFQGDVLPDDQAKKIADKLAEFTGIDAAEILRAHLQIDEGYFETKLLQSATRHLGCFDARYIYLGPGGDELTNSPRNALYGAFNAYLAGELGFHTQQPYHLLSRVQWGDDMSHLNSFSLIQTDLVQNPGLKVLITGGRYDLVLPYYAAKFGLNQLHLDPALRANVQIALYPSGHASYLDTPSRILLKTDFDRWLNGVVHPAP